VISPITGRQPVQRIWSAASSTGEEIYTLSFVLADTLGLESPWQVTGSDISTAVLATAERGLYWLDRTRGLPQSYLKKYCLKGVRSQEGSFMIAPEIKRHTRFLQVNLNQDAAGRWASSTSSSCAT
jgi:chemotaxis protein methyltransferase CheR